MRSFIICTVTRKHYNDQIRRMRWMGHFTCLRCKFWSENLKGRKDHLKDKGMNGRITLKYVLNEYYEDMDRIHLTQDRDQWQAFVNMVMKIQVH
jgi:hypothetical protein